MTRDEVLAWLKEHPQSSARTIANGLGYSDDRYVFIVLETAELTGQAKRSRKRMSMPWLWEVT